MANLSGDGIAPHVVKRVLEFLNNAQSAEYFTSLPYLYNYLGHHNYDPSTGSPISVATANNILAERANLGGTFTDLSQLSNITGLGQPEFYELVQFFSKRLSPNSGPMPKVNVLSFMTVHAPEVSLTATASDIFVTRRMDGDVSASVQRIQMSSLPTFSAFQTQFADIWDWSLFIKENRNTLKASDLPDIAPNAAKDDQGIRMAWDVLAHTFDSGTEDLKMREATLMVLVGNHVLDHFKRAQSGNAPSLNDNGHWRRLANSKVVLPDNFKNTPSVTPPVAAVQRPIPSRDRKHRAQHLGLVAVQESKYWKGLLDEVSDLDRRHKRDRAVAEDAANEAYDLQVEPIFRQIDQNQTSPTQPTGEEEIYPYEQVPDFRFSFDKALSASYLTGKVSDDVIGFVQKNRLEDRGANEALERLQLNLRDAEKRSGARFQRKVGSLRINAIPTTARPYYSYAFSADRIRQNAQGSNVPVYFSFSTGYNGAYFRNFSARLFINGQTFTDATPDLLYNENGMIFVRLFAPSGVPLDMGQQSTYTLTLTFALDNGKSFNFTAEAHVQSRVNNGVTNPQFTPGTPTPINLGQLYGASELGIARFRRIEQQLCCYVPGEVSHIENIMAREHKEKNTSTVTTTVSELESESETVQFAENETTEENRFEISQSIEQVLAQEFKSGIGFESGFTGVYGTGEYSNISANGKVTANLDFSLSNTTTSNNARTFAEDITQRALERLQKTMKLRRKTTITRQYTESYKHGFDNRAGDEHVTGIYRWIDKVYKNELVDYGDRLLYEFMIPEPSKFFHQVFYALAEEGEIDSGGTIVTVEKPTPLSEQGINSADDITRDNYQNIAAIYGASVTAPQEEFKYATVNLNGGVGTKDKSEDKIFTATVPPEYECIEITFDVNYSYIARTGNKARISIAGGGNTWQRLNIRGKGSGSVFETYNVSNIAVQVPVNVSTFKISTYNGSASLKCALAANVFDKWQQATYQAILTAYNNKLQEYELALAAAEANAGQQNAEESEATNRASNSKLNIQVIIRELKRLSIEMLTRPFGIQMGSDFYNEGECDVPELNLGDALDDYGDVVKFFEQAFDWELMAYRFYPYYWAKRCDWAELMKRQNGKDLLFEEFLQAGMGRVVAPVRVGFEDAVLFYMQTGQVWMGTSVTINDPLYLSIQEELAKPQGTVIGDPWYSVVPSTLNIIQAGSAYLAEEGLPCCNDLEGEDLNLLGGNSLLEGLGG